MSIDNNKYTPSGSICADLKDPHHTHDRSCTGLNYEITQRRLLFGDSGGYNVDDTKKLMDQ